MRQITGGEEFLFWVIVFVIVIGAGVCSIIVERKRRPKSIWMRQFEERNP